MLRLIVLVLVLVNGVYFAWTRGYLRVYGYGPHLQSEPQRLQRQIRPDDVRILTAEEVARAEAPAVIEAERSAPAECLVAGVFDENQAATLQAALESGLPTGSWQLERNVVPARWIIYMGRYANVQARENKRAELRNLKIKYEPLSRADMEPGLSLGAFTSQEAAKAGLQALNRRGVRTARVVLERAQQQTAQLRIAAADEAIKARLQELGPALAGKALQSCP